jgi:hypothetical protein
MNARIDEYRRYAADHGRHTLDGDVDATNFAYDELQRVFVSIVRAGFASELFQLYDDRDPWVQSWAAAHSLEVDPERALDKLRQLETAGIPHVSTGAKYTIEGWNNGTLRFLPG